jgi:hypothetical protein
MLLNSARDYSCRAKIEVLRTKPKDVKPCWHIWLALRLPLDSFFDSVASLPRSELARGRSGPFRTR